MKYCQGPFCHTYETKDRIRGPKGDKYYQTRRRSSMYYGKGNFCSLSCYNDWAEVFSDRAIDHFGRIVEPIKLTEENAWVKDYDWDWQSGTTSNHRFVNRITQQLIPITEQQYNNPDLVRPN